LLLGPPRDASDSLVEELENLFLVRRESTNRKIVRLFNKDRDCH
jgi:hypothetical protein